MPDRLQKITPFLWFDTEAEEAMNFYLSVFKDSKQLDVSRMGPDGPVMSASFVLNGQEFMALNAGPQFKFNEAVSFFVSCETQDEVNYFWDKLTEGGKEGRCGWLKDKFGLSWQIVPTALGTLLGDPDPVKSKRALEAMMKMNKLNIEQLEVARNDSDSTAQ